MPTALALGLAVTSVFPCKARRPRPAGSDRGDGDSLGCSLQPAC